MTNYSLEELLQFEKSLVDQIAKIVSQMESVPKPVSSSLDKKVKLNWNSIFFNLKNTIPKQQEELFELSNKKRLKNLYYKERKKIEARNSLKPSKVTSKKTKIITSRDIKTDKKYFKRYVNQVLLMDLRFTEKTIEEIETIGLCFFVLCAINQMYATVCYIENFRIPLYGNNTFSFQWKNFLKVYMCQLQSQRLTDTQCAKAQKYFLALFINSQAFTKEGLSIFPSLINVLNTYNCFHRGKIPDTDNEGLPLMMVSFDLKELLTKEIILGEQLLDKNTWVTITFLTNKIEGPAVEIPATLPMDVAEVVLSLMEKNVGWNLNVGKLVLGTRTLLLDIASTKKRETLYNVVPRKMDLKYFFAIMDYKYLLNNNNSDSKINVFLFVDEFFTRFKLGNWVIFVRDKNGVKTPIKLSDLESLKNVPEWKPSFNLVFEPNLYTWSRQRSYNGLPEFEETNVNSSEPVMQSKKVFSIPNTEVNKPYSSNLDFLKDNFIEKLFVFDAEDEVRLVPRKMRINWDRLDGDIKSLIKEFDDLPLENILVNKENPILYGSFTHLQESALSLMIKYFSELRENNELPSDHDYFERMFKVMLPKVKSFPNTDWFNKRHSYKGLFPKSFAYARIKDLYDDEKRTSALKYDRLYEKSQKESSQSSFYDGAVTFFSPFKKNYFSFIAKTAFNSFLFDLDFSACHAKICLGTYQLMMRNKFNNSNTLNSEDLNAKEEKTGLEQDYNCPDNETFNPNWTKVFDIISKIFYQKNKKDLDGAPIPKDFLLKNGLNRSFIKSYILALINGRDPKTPLIYLTKSHECLALLAEDPNLISTKKDKEGNFRHKYENILKSLQKIILSFEFVQQIISWSKEINSNQDYLFGKKILEQLVEENQLEELLKKELKEIYSILKKLEKTKVSKILLVIESLLIIAFALDLFTQKIPIVSLEFDGLKVLSGEFEGIETIEELNKRLENSNISKAKFPIYTKVVNRLLKCQIDLSIEVYLEKKFEFLKSIPGENKDLVQDTTLNQQGVYKQIPLPPLKKPEDINWNWEKK